jgi:hypothetical protein
MMTYKIAKDNQRMDISTHTPHTYKTVGTKFIQWADAIGNDKNLRQPCNALSVWNMWKKFEFTLWNLLPWT